MMQMTCIGSANCAKIKRSRNLKNENKEIKIKMCYIAVKRSQKL